MSAPTPTPTTTTLTPAASHNTATDGKRVVVSGNLVTMSAMCIGGKEVSKADMYAALGLTEYVAQNPQRNVVNNKIK